MIAGLAITALSGVAAADTTSNWMDRMHDSPAMEQMREKMPAGAQEQCEKMHSQMMGGSMMGGSMMDGSGMMGGPLSAA
jgi:hypothetical protein